MDLAAVDRDLSGGCGIETQSPSRDAYPAQAFLPRRVYIINLVDLSLVHAL